MKLKFCALAGDAYALGYQSGYELRSALQREAKHYKKILEGNYGLKTAIQERAREVRLLLPDYHTEACGKADGAEIAQEVYWAMLCPELTEEVSHCTTIVLRRDDGSLILSHNEDDCYTEDNHCISKVCKGEKDWFVTNDTANMPFGNGFSWNSHGIVKTINYCHEEWPSIGDIPRYFMQRYISEATSLADFVGRCKAFKVASGFHAIALDKKAHEAISVEVYPNGKVSVIDIEKTYVHSNHYIHGDKGKKPELDEGSNSVLRLQKATEWVDTLDTHSTSTEDLRKILEHRAKDNSFENSIWQNINDEYLTAFNFVFDTKAPDCIDLKHYLTNKVYRANYGLSGTISEVDSSKQVNWTYDRIMNCSQKDALFLMTGRVDYSSIERKNELDTDDFNAKFNFIHKVVNNRCPNIFKRK